ncbi:MAG: hypothetical protein PHF86_11740 [Candidatus Nanoarchaeia archaeon]|nr:hypothetical protein [Candidatus Nanoarchaeia archaeon]
MQYILTQEELDTLTSKDVGVNREQLQELCSLAAIHVPVDRHWNAEDKTPWGCILVQSRNPGYCDECPVTKYCPYKFKHYSK